MSHSRRFHGQFNPPVDQYLFERFFPSLRGGVAMECGAFDGVTESSCYFFEESRGWHGVNVEASPPIFSQLLKNRPNSTNIHAALSNHSGSATFTHVISPIHGENFGNGSLDHQAAHREELVRDGCEFVNYEIRTMTYPELIAEAGIKQLDLFVLDIEGHEMSVIESMRQSSVLPRVFCVEHGHLGVERIQQAMAGLPFRYDSSSHVNSFFVNELNPPPRPYALRRLWSRLRGF